MNRDDINKDVSYILTNILDTYAFRLGNFTSLKRVNSERDSMLLYFVKREGKPS